MLPPLRTTLLAIGLLGLLAPAASTQAPDTKLRSASSVDTDADGRVDRIELVFSGNVRGSARPSSFEVRGRRVTLVGEPRGRRLGLVISEEPGCDIGAKPLVRYLGQSLRDSSGRRVARSVLDMGGRDRSLPRITCAETVDANGDSRLDAINLVYSRRVTNRPQAGGAFLFSVKGYRLRSVGLAQGRSVVLQLEQGGAPDVGARPQVSYRRPKTRAMKPFAVRAPVGQAFSGVFKAVRDRHVPLTPTSARAAEKSSPSRSRR